MVSEGENTCAKPKIGIIVGSTRRRPLRRPAGEWIAELAAARAEIEVETLDLRDYPMPFFNEVGGAGLRPGRGRGGAALAEEDRRRSTASSCIAAEYNRGPTGGAEERARLRLQRVEQEGRWPSSAMAASAAPARSSSSGCTRSSCRWRRSAPASTSCGPTWSPCGRARRWPSSPISTERGSDMLDQLIWWTQALATARRADIEEAEIRAA